jgi:hypothetical protein
VWTTKNLNTTIHVSLREPCCRIFNTDLNNKRGGKYLGVDGVKIFFPKLPVHIRIHKESFERNQRVKASVERAKSGQKKLDELNNALKPTVTANSTPTAVCEALPDIQQDALHNLPYGTVVGTLPLESTEKKCKRSD